MNMREKITAAIADPGKYVGFRGDRSMSGWQADAVLAVLREPSEAMLDAAERFVVYDPETEGLNEYSDDLWRAMIDAASTDSVGVGGER